MVEVYYLRMFSSYHIYRISLLFRNSRKESSGTILGKIISTFIILAKIGQVFVELDSFPFKATYASQYGKRKYSKLSLAAAAQIFLFYSYSRKLIL
jgi:hypothetical protein